MGFEAQKNCVRYLKWREALNLKCSVILGGGYGKLPYIHKPYPYSLLITVRYQRKVWWFEASNPTFESRLTVDLSTSHDRNRWNTSLKMNGWNLKIHPFFLNQIYIFGVQKMLLLQGVQGFSSQPGIACGVRSKIYQKSRVSLCPFSTGPGLNQCNKSKIPPTNSLVSCERLKFHTIVQWEQNPPQILVKCCHQVFISADVPKWIPSDKLT